MNTIDHDNIEIPEEALDGVRWSQSPLRFAMSLVERYGTEYRETRIGKNKATTLKVYACEELALILAEMTAGDRDALGYPIEEEG